MVCGCFFAHKLKIIEKKGEMLVITNSSNSIPTMIWGRKASGLIPHRLQISLSLPHRRFAQQYFAFKIHLKSPLYFWDFDSCIKVVTDQPLRSQNRSQLRPKQFQEPVRDPRKHRRRLTDLKAEQRALQNSINGIRLNFCSPKMPDTYGQFSPQNTNVLCSWMQSS